MNKMKRKEGRKEDFVARGSKRARGHNKQEEIKRTRGTADDLKGSVARGFRCEADSEDGGEVKME